jgi:hypothetical protein
LVEAVAAGAVPTAVLANSCSHATTISGLPTRGWRASQ